MGNRNDGEMTLTTTLDTDTCRKCSAPLEQKDRGRNKRVCGTPCRRAAEYERKRIQNALETVEGRIA